MKGLSEFWSSMIANAVLLYAFYVTCVFQKEMETLPKKEVLHLWKCKD